MIAAPNFIGIGPEKTATTWLYGALAQHPDVNMPPKKEIGYFWEKSFLPGQNYMSRFVSKHWFYKARRQYMMGSFLYHFRNLAVMKMDAYKFLWDLHFIFLPHTDAWYARLFDRRSVSGDISPKYCELAASDIADIKRRFGQTKILLSVRDPVEREWSRAKQNLCMKRKRRLEEVPERRWLRHFDHSVQSSVNDYAMLYERWSRSFGEGNVLLIFYDEVNRDGWAVFKRICQFLELDQLPDRFKERIVRPANVGISRSIPKSYEKYLYQKHKEKVAVFADRFPDCPYPLEWLKKHDRSLKTG